MESSTTTTVILTILIRHEQTHHTTNLTLLCNMQKHTNKQVNAKVSSNKYPQKYLEDTILYHVFSHTLLKNLYLVHFVYAECF